MSEFRNRDLNLCTRLAWLFWDTQFTLLLSVVRGVRTVFEGRATRHVILSAIQRFHDVFRKHLI